MVARAGARVCARASRRGTGAPSCCGTVPTTRSPRGARPSRRGMARLRPAASQEARGGERCAVSRALAWRACVGAGA
jgi:hypothetical protein